MRLKEDHMLNSQLKPAYNVQIGVESEYIIGLGLFPNPTDTTTLPPFLDRVQEKTGHKIKNIVAAGVRERRELYLRSRFWKQNAFRSFRSNIWRIPNPALARSSNRAILSCSNARRSRMISTI